MFKTIAKAAFAALVSISAAIPATAAPFVPAKPAVQQPFDAPVITIRDHNNSGERWIDRRARRNEYRQQINPYLPDQYVRPGDNRPIYREPNQVRRDFYRDGRYGYYRGHRGYRDYRANYRRYNGFWFPAAAFALGAVIGSQSSPVQIGRPGYLSRDHVVWCNDRYRTYRASDNTYVPRVGFRAQCRSPY